MLDKPSKEKKGSFVHVGLLKEVQIDKKLSPGLRVTVEMLLTPSGEYLVCSRRLQYCLGKIDAFRCEFVCA